MAKHVFFRANLAKAFAAVPLIAESLHQLDKREADWIAYMADRDHLNRFGRPVLGLRYRNRGGLPESRELAEVFASNGDGTACIVSDGVARRRAGVPIDCDLFSKSDLTAISGAVMRLLSVNRMPRSEDMPSAWCDETDGGWVGYERMLDAGQNGVAWLEDITAAAPYVRF
ncbi:hypothetical protein GOB57_07990 [Sinorhizobium meliloti]|nr:hypothetical protein [Sinorhizobium meliloti]